MNALTKYDCFGPRTGEGDPCRMKYLKNGRFCECQPFRFCSGMSEVARFPPISEPAWADKFRLTSFALSLPLLQPATFRSHQRQRPPRRKLCLYMSEQRTFHNAPPPWIATAPKDLRKDAWVSAKSVSLLSTTFLSVPRTGAKLLRQHRILDCETLEL